MFELDFDTKYILVVIEFEYHSSKSRNIPNDLREAFLGIEPPKGRGNPNVPQKVKVMSNYDREILYPIHFSLIKKPVTIDIPGKRSYKTRNTAVGAIILYEYLGLLKDYQGCCIELEKLIKEKIKNKKPAHFASITNVKLIIGYDLKDVSK